MKCPMCESVDSSVIDSRYLKHDESPYKRRRRQCICGHRFSTYEVMQLDDLDTTITIKTNSRITIKTTSSTFDETAIDIMNYIKEKYETKS